MKNNSALLPSPDLANPSGIGRRRLLQGSLAATAAIAGAAVAPMSWAEDRYPSKPVRMVIPYPPGQATDIYGRLFGERLAQIWGQGVVVDNRAGGSGIIGMESIKNSPADGYTLGMVASGPMAINPGVFSKLPYDPVKDFTAISLGFVAPLVVLVNNDLPVRNIAQLLELLHAKPGQLSYASGGPGTSQHLASEMFKLATKSFATHIPYRGSAPALTDLIGGQVQFTIDSVSAALTYIQSGRLRALAVTSLQRNAALPDVPTIAESGVPSLKNFEAVGWAGLVGPKGMPPAVVQKISQDFATVLADPAIIQRVVSSGSVVRPIAGADFSRFIENEVAKWGAAARASNTKLG